MSKDEEDLPDTPSIEMVKETFSQVTVNPTNNNDSKSNSDKDDSQ